MRMFGYLGIGLLIWLLAPAPMAVTLAETATPRAASGTTQPQPTPEEEDLLNTLD
jgi:hypothetical protein